MFSEHNPDCSLSIELLFLIQLSSNIDCLPESSSQLGYRWKMFISAYHNSAFMDSVHSKRWKCCFIYMWRIIIEELWQCSLSLQRCKMFHSITQQFSHWFATMFTDSLKLMSLTNYCLQRVQFYCMLYVNDSPYSLSQNMLKSSIMFISHIYKQYY